MQETGWRKQVLGLAMRMGKLHSLKEHRLPLAAALYHRNLLCCHLCKMSWIESTCTEIKCSENPNNPVFSLTGDFSASVMHQHPEGTAETLKTAAMFAPLWFGLWSEHLLPQPTCKQKACLFGFRRPPGTWDSETQVTFLHTESHRWNPQVIKSEAVPSPLQGKSPGFKTITGAESEGHLHRIGSGLCPHYGGNCLHTTSCRKAIIFKLSPKEEAPPFSREKPGETAFALGA